MTTTLTRVLHTGRRAQKQGTQGVQDDLIITEAPAGAAHLIGKPLRGQTLNVNGAYVCLLPIGGCAQVEVSVRATLTTATATSAGPDECAVFDPRVDSIANATTVTNGDGDGALTTATLQTARLLATGGRYARYTITIASAGTAAFTVAEWRGIPVMEPAPSS